MKLFYKRSALTLAILASSANLAAMADDDRQVNFSVKAQPLVSAIKEFSKQSGIQIGYDSDLSVGLSSLGVNDSISIEKGLESLLKGTGLTYEFINDATVILKTVVNPDENDEGERQPKVVEEVVVTGSRIRSNAQPTSYLKVVHREDFEKLGLASAEDIVRYLPQNFSAVNSGTTSTGQGNNTTPIGTLGQSAANLRGLGSSATLVLVNGRRIAGSPNYEGDGTINLSTIPSAAIERVEILLEGASAIYGSDALGGVINFILRKNWTGSETTVRYENSAHDGDIRSINQVLGTTWETGNATLTLGYKESDSVNGHKAGYNSSDYSSKGGSDFRTYPISPTSGRPAYYLPSRNGYAVFLGALPQGYTGSDWTIDDLSFDNLDVYDSVAVRGVNGTSISKDKTVTLNFEQELAGTFVAFGDFLYSDKTNKTTSNIKATPFFGPEMGADNPHNNLGIPVTVDYLFGDEPLPAMDNHVDLDRFNANLGVRFDLSDSWRMSVVASYGTERNRSYSTELGGAAYLSALAGFQVDEEGELILDGSGDPIPVPAINYFTGEHDEGLDWSSFVVPRFSNGETTSKNESLEFSADGDLFSIAGGEVKLAVGGQLRTESYDLSDNGFAKLVNNLDGVDPLLERDVQAAFFEASIPAISEQNSLPGIQALVFTVAGRWEEYTMEHQFNGPDSPKEEKVFNEFSPKIGFMWQPIDEVRVRASWAESFRAPSLLALAEPPTFWGNFEYEDIDHPDFPGETVTYNVDQYRAGNPNLLPETATTISAGVEWMPTFLEGLTISATYTEIDWEDKIETLRYSDVRLASNTELYPDIYIRGEDGYLVELYQRAVNLSQSTTEVVDLNTRYDFDTNLGAFYVGLAAVYTLDASNTILEGEAPTELVATDFGPDELVLRAEMGWNAGGFGLNLLASYSSSYDYTDFGRRELTGQPFDPVEHYSTIDLTGFYNADNNWQIKAGVRNLFNNQYPFVNSFRSPYDPQRVDTRGRIIYMDVRKSFDF
ncbi:TonB-dependent receptor [Porticoccaceae bacterium LTM1]|nr:TonB-dependent receptor [Porticoccaceae bacterium LTM1]